MERRISIFGNLHQQSALGHVVRLLVCLDQVGFSISVEKSFYCYLLDNQVLPDLPLQVCEHVPADCECVVSCGGDGTFLNAITWLAGRPVPVIGLNTGHLGYLAAFPADHPEGIAMALRDRSLRVEKRYMLRLYGQDLPDGIWLYALNEVALLKDDTASMINVNAHINGKYLADYAVDGLLVATPTGSTAYNLSVGGPLLEPSLRNMIISPVAPHSLTMRPLVVSADSRIELTVASRSGSFRVSLDGRSFTLPAGSKLSIRSAEMFAHILLPAEQTFADTLRRKLGWAT